MLLQTRGRGGGDSTSVDNFFSMPPCLADALREIRYDTRDEKLEERDVGVGHGVAAQVEIESNFESRFSNFESRFSSDGFKRLIPGAFNAGFDRVNLHRLTMEKPRRSNMVSTVSGWPSV
jgi:hypothetical protein